MCGGMFVCKYLRRILLVRDVRMFHRHIFCLSAHLQRSVFFFRSPFSRAQAIYDMLGACSSNRPADSAEERAKNIFAKMDENNDGQLTQDEFLKGCLQDEELSKMLAP